jgi:outer membrane protein
MQHTMSPQLLNSSSPRLILLLALVMLLPAFSNAQEVWSLERCLNHAMTHNLSIQQQRLSGNRAENDLKQSMGALLPNLNAGSNQGFNYGRTIDRFTNEFATERVSFQDMYLSTEVNLFAGFQQINNIRMNLARNTAFRYDTEKFQNDIILSIASAYLQILYFEDMVEVAGQQLAVSQQQVERTRILLEGGTVARGALLEIEAQASQEELNLLNAQNNLTLANLELIHLLDLDPGQAFAIERPSLEVSDTYIFYRPGDVFEKALGHEPSVLASQFRIDMAEKSLEMSRGERYPRIAFTSYIGTGYSGAARRLENMVPVSIPYRDQINDNFNFAMQLRLQVPIFNRFQVKTRIQNAQLDLENARLVSDITRNNLNKTIQQAHADALAAYQKYQGTLKSQDAFQESFHYAEQRFNLGMLSSIEYNEAKARMARSEIEALQSKYEFIFKVKILEFYQGEGFVL